MVETREDASVAVGRRSSRGIGQAENGRGAQPDGRGTVAFVMSHGGAAAFEIRVPALRGPREGGAASPEMNGLNRLLNNRFRLLSKAQSYREKPARREFRSIVALRPNPPGRSGAIKPWPGAPVVRRVLHA